MSSISDQIAIAIDRKSKEDELRNSEQKFKTIFKTSPNSMTISSIEDGTFVDINDEFIKLMGYSRKEIVGEYNLSIKDIPNNAKISIKN